MALTLYDTGLSYIVYNSIMDTIKKLSIEAFTCSFFSSLLCFVCNQRKMVKEPCCRKETVKSLDELLDSADHALFRVIVRNPHHVLHPLLPPRKRTVYSLRKLTHGLTIPPACSSLMHNNFLIRMLYTDVYWHLSVHLYCHLSTFITDI